MPSRPPPALTVAKQIPSGEWDDDAETAHTRRLDSDEGVLGQRGTLVGASSFGLDHRPQPRPGGRQRYAERSEWSTLHCAPAAELARLLSLLRRRCRTDSALPRGRGAVRLSGSDVPAPLAALADRSIRHALACRPGLLSHALLRTGRQPGSTDLRGHPALYRAIHGPRCRLSQFAGDARLLDRKSVV